MVGILFYLVGLFQLVCFSFLNYASFFCILWKIWSSVFNNDVIIAELFFFSLLRHFGSQFLAFPGVLLLLYLFWKTVRKCSSVNIPVNIYIAKWVANQNQLIHTSTFLPLTSHQLDCNRTCMKETACLHSHFLVPNKLNKSTLHACPYARRSLTC